MLATLDVHGPVATLTLNRPEARNALSIELLGALHHRVDELARTPGVGVVVVTGAGACFCAGMDLKAVLGDASAGAALLTSLAGLTLKVRSLPAVVLAKVNGAAIGGGCGLACVCDLALTHDDAKLGFPEVDLGVCPAVVAPWLVRKIGTGRARAVLLRGGLMTGRDAAAIGIVDRSAGSREELDTLAAETADRLSKGGPMALAATKGLLNEIDGSLDASLVMRGAELSARVLAGEEAQQRLRSKIG
ncbi:MAG: enoyl-CoA hydratase/isomerase family protein [Phycisphaeraceae bacterium]|nr:MAG: enoyl-CoA hydratase/isomerase family protein [Phycisphaeraceae bacterium]